MIVLEYPVFIDMPCVVALPLKYKILSVNVVSNTPIINVLDTEETIETQNHTFYCFTQNQVMPPDGMFQYIGSCVIFNKQYHIFERIS